MQKDLAVIYGTNSLSDLDALKGDLEATVGAILKKRILGGVLLRTVLSTTPTEIPHTLGKQYDGYIVVKRESWDATNEVLLPNTPFTGSIYEAKSEDPELFISLYSTGDVAVNVWVF